MIEMCVCGGPMVLSEQWAGALLLKRVLRCRYCTRERSVK